MITEIAAITVKQLNFYVKSLLEGDSHLQYVTVTGELSNFKNHYASGHWYFTLKDEDAAIRCVMFRAMANGVRFDPRDGDTVVLRGRVSLYEKDGQYQFYAEQMFPVGAGALALQFERIKEKLNAEGLFDTSRKKPLPKYPKNIAVVTSDTGAAVKDILSILKRRYPVARVIMCPVTVQGETAVPQMLAALDRLYRLNAADVIIMGRGGGSAEDLWEFNDETLARKIALSTVPVISAVGHETDFTICDFVADMRAPTPSAAAELAVPDLSELENRFARFESLLKSALTAKYERENARLAGVLSSRFFKNPETSLTERRAERADRAADALLSAFSAIISEKSGCLAEFAARLDTLSPLKTLARGYAVAIKSGETVRKAEELNAGDSITLKFTDGNVKCKVTEKEQTV